MDKAQNIVIGAGMGGMATAIRLAAAGEPVRVIEAHDAPGGRARQVASIAGPVDAGPTVLTMRWVFDDLFGCAGARLEDHVTLHKQDVLARHWWPDGSTLDLHADSEASTEAVRAFSGDRSAAQFRAFSLKAAQLFDAFDAPLMRSARPSIARLTARVVRRPGLIPQMAPFSTLARSLAKSFDDPRLQQLFGRYATYVGGSPYQSPAVLALIWQAEAAGVHVVEGGMHGLARAMERLAVSLGVHFDYGSPVRVIRKTEGGLAVETDGQAHIAETVTFNGDPRALATGLVGEDVSEVAPQTRSAERALSANVWSFAARPGGPRAAELAHHNVFFCADPVREFDDLRQGRMPRDPTLYVCAEDRGTPTPPTTNEQQTERFEIIMNAPPLRPGVTPQAEEADTCLTRTFPILRNHGLSFDQIPVPAMALTGPQGFERLFPATQGSLYGQSPHGMMAAFQRPQAVTKVPGLYLCGGGTHPGAGVPMSALSGAHAAEAILTRRTSTSRSGQTATPGGTLTPSPIAGPVRSPSSPS